MARLYTRGGLPKAMVWYSTRTLQQLSFVKEEENKMALYKFHWDCCRQGDLGGTFEAEPESISNLIGKEVCFGEVLGKHSDVSVVMEKDDIELLTDDEDFIDKAHLYGLIPNGFNPFHYLSEVEDDE